MTFLCLYSDSYTAPRDTVGTVQTLSLRYPLLSLTKAWASPSEVRLWSWKQ